MQAVPCIHFRIDRNIKLTMKIKIIAPIKAGTIAYPPITGPKLPNSFVPSQEPTIPAIILPITPPGTSLPVIKLANHPNIPPTIIKTKSCESLLYIETKIIIRNNYLSLVMFHFS